MLFLRQTRVITADICKTGMTKDYWQFMGKNLLLGLWGRNFAARHCDLSGHDTSSYLSAYKMPGAIE
jgi:hypothetical protein